MAPKRRCSGGAQAAARSKRQRDIEADPAGEAAADGLTHDEDGQAATLSGDGASDNEHSSGGSSAEGDGEEYTPARRRSRGGRRGGARGRRGGRGRGARGGRASAAAAGHAHGDGGDDEEAAAGGNGHDDGEGAASGDEGAAGAAGAHREELVPLPDLDAAVAQLVRLTGLSDQAARRALEENRGKVLGPVEQVHAAAAAGGAGAGAGPAGSHAAGAAAGAGQAGAAAAAGGAGGAGGPAAGAAGGGVRVSRSESRQLMESWLEEAQLWMALGMEAQDEVEAMGAAMRESLAEEEARRAQELPLLQQPPQQLLEHLEKQRRMGCGSRLLAALGGGAGGCVCPYLLLGEGGHKPRVAELLDYETKCRRWYPNRGTSLFFERLADEVLQSAAEAAAAAGAPALLRGGWLACGRHVAGGADQQGAAGGGGGGGGEGAAPGGTGAGSEAAAAAAGCAVCAAALGPAQEGGGGAGSAHSHPHPHHQHGVHGLEQLPHGGRAGVGAAAAQAVLLRLGEVCGARYTHLLAEVSRMLEPGQRCPALFAALEPDEGGGGAGGGGAGGPEGGDDDDEIEVVECTAAGRAGSGRVTAEVSLL